jgi:hypothetical protein
MPWTALRLRFVRSALLLLLALALAGCGGSDARDRAAAPSDGIRDLDNVLALRSDFESDKGSTRLVVLLSPT